MTRKRFPSLDYFLAPKVAGSSVTALGPQDTGGGYRMHLAVPLYTTPPSSVWNTYNALGYPKLDIVVFTPDASQDGAGGTGPGVGPVAAFTTAVTAAVAAGCRVLGYIATDYTARDLADVYADIDNFFTYYPNISGIFIDTVDGNSSSLGYYAAIKNHLNGKTGKFLVLNPGTNVDEGFMQVADVICTFEDTYANYLTYTPSSWAVNYDGRRFWHLIHTCDSQAKADIAFDLAHQRNCSYVFITDGVMDFPWTPLSSWHTELVAKVTASNNAQDDFIDIPGCVGAWTADSVTKDGSNNISAVADLAAIKHNLASGGTAPLWVANQINGRPIIRFGGAGYLHNDTFEVDQAWTAWVVYKGTPDDAVVLGSTDASSVGIYHESNHLNVTSNGNYQDTLVTVPAGFNVVVWTQGGYAGSLRKLWLNGVRIHNNFPNLGTWNWVNVGLGGYSTGNNKYTGDVYGAGFYNRALNKDGITRLHQVISYKTGLTLPSGV